MRFEDVGLSAAEYQRVETLLGRAPNAVELGLFGALWSEHCSYKNTKGLLTRLPHSGPHVVQGPGENAGVVRLDERFEVAFKVESHNHPSYVEPVEGAATGVGGILRDIIAMGARPVAVADMLRFGRDAASLRLLAGVVKGVGQYGNAIGIPTVTGDLAFSDSYRTNPLVNVLAVGVRDRLHRTSASTARPGHLMVLVGQRTGRDGIHGASLLASRDFSSVADDLRPTVQVGDPFLGKLLMEATLLTVSRGLAGALQDLGAAGLTSAAAELCYASGVGATIDLDQVFLRQSGLSAYEIMLSETQERMLLAVSPENLEAVAAIFSHYEILFSVIGEVTAEPNLRVTHHNQVVADLPARALAGQAPVRPVDTTWWEGLADSPPASSSSPPPVFRPAMLMELLADWDLRDRAPIYQQYDSTIQTRTVYGPGHDVAVLTVPDSVMGLAVAVFGTGRWAALDPYAGGAAAVLQVLARLAAQGAEPLGLTDGVNAGNPEVEESYGALAALLRGVADAARAVEVPVTGGNVSLHNETDGHAIWPTVMIGAVGRHPHPLRPVADKIVADGAVVALVHPAPCDWRGSTAAFLFEGPSAYSRPDLGRAAAVLSAMREWVSQTAGVAVRTLGSGGLALGLIRLLAESDPEWGVDLQLQETGGERTARFFNEGALQWLVCMPPGVWDSARAFWAGRGVEIRRLGTTARTGKISLDGGRVQWSRAELLGAWREVRR